MNLNENLAAGLVVRCECDCENAMDRSIFDTLNIILVMRIFSRFRITFSHRINILDFSHFRIASIASKERKTLIFSKISEVSKKLSLQWLILLCSGLNQSELRTVSLF
jgi:hypothetical protein